MGLSVTQGSETVGTLGAASSSLPTGSGTSSLFRAGWIALASGRNVSEETGAGEATLAVCADGAANVGTAGKQEREGRHFTSPRSAIWLPPPILGTAREIPRSFSPEQRRPWAQIWPSNGRRRDSGPLDKVLP